MNNIFIANFTSTGSKESIFARPPQLVLSPGNQRGVLFPANSANRVCEGDTKKGLQPNGPPKKKLDGYFNEWAYDPISDSWQDEFGGKVFHNPLNTLSNLLHTPDGKIWGLEHCKLWVSNSGDVQRKRPLVGSKGWSYEHVSLWASSSGDLTLEWPSKRWQRLHSPGGAGRSRPSGIVKVDSLFNVWTYDAKRRAWFDEHGGKMLDDPLLFSSTP